VNAAVIHELRSARIGTVIVTGSGGFVGRRIVAALRSLGTRVVEIRSRSDCDLRDPGQVKKRLHGCRPDVIVHLAASPDEGGTTVDGPQYTNTVLCAVNTAQLASPNSPCLFVNVGSYKQYGRIGLPFLEEATPRPERAYGFAKQVSEEVIRQREGGDFRAVYLRLGPVVGEGQRATNLVPNVVLAIRDGRAQRLGLADVPWDPVYIDDAIEAILLAIARRLSWGQTINVSGGLGISVQQVVTAIARLMAAEHCLAEMRRFHGAVLPMVGDISRARRLLGWRPHTPLLEALRRCIEHYAGPESLRADVAGGFES
jgi:GDP-L-fucose synthase